MVKKAVVNKLYLVILNDHNRMFKSVENEFVLFLAFKLCMNAFDETVAHLKQKIHIHRILEQKL